MNLAEQIAKLEELNSFCDKPVLVNNAVRKEILCFMDSGIVSPAIILEMCRRIQHAKTQHSHEGYRLINGLTVMENEYDELLIECQEGNLKNCHEENLDVLATSYRFAELVEKLRIKALDDAMENGGLVMQTLEVYWSSFPKWFTTQVYNCCEKREKERGDGFVCSAHVPRLLCKDGFSMSVQAHSEIYSKPRWYGKSNFPQSPFIEVEVGFPSAIEDLLMPYMENTGDDALSSVFPYVPIEIVEQIILKHGGLDYSKGGVNDENM